jgi:hypothetical protein
MLLYGVLAVEFTFECFAFRLRSNAFHGYTLNTAFPHRLPKKVLSDEADNLPHLLYGFLAFEYDLQYITVGMRSNAFHGLLPKYGVPRKLQNVLFDEAYDMPYLP